MGQAELFPVGQQAEEIAGVLAAGDQKDIANSRIHQCPDGIVNHRLVVNRQKMLVRNLRQRMQPAAGSASKDNTFH